ncbi:hypothetical protein RvY_13084 [Ramazzottius varieornatus]|uniref:Protein kinase domain-containing protein n=1 Tax=Ramazzottius varieornatus TaxID=947166 RepID=A0A1D1VNX6_RAMVA|nr:hypothetical protein RvY_13084 [Ramazzottius varieornatus]
MATNAQSCPLRDAFKAEPMSSNQPNSSTAGSAKESAKEPGSSGRRGSSRKRPKEKEGFQGVEGAMMEKELKNMTLDKYTIDISRTLGEGSYAKVCTATHVDNRRIYACKVINDKKEMGNFIERFLPRELKLMRKFSSRWVTCVHGIFKTHNLYYILMDFCENGDLLRYLQRRGAALDEDEVREKSAQILMGVRYLHEDLQIAHRDLKCENILIDSSNRLKLGDFGFARSTLPLVGQVEVDQIEDRLIKDFMTSSVATLPITRTTSKGTRRSSTERASEIARLDKMATTASAAAIGRSPSRPSRISDAGTQQAVVASATFCGSVAYAAPEVLSRKSYDPKKYDMWSTGVIVFIMACFFMPFDDSDQAKMVRRQLAKKWRYPPEARISDSLKEFLEGMMEPSPKERMSVMDSLRHKWLRKSYRDILEKEARSNDT